MQAIKSSSGSGGSAKKSKNPWNSLEVAKIIVGASTPIVLALFTYFTTKQSHEQEVSRHEQEVARARESHEQELARTALLHDQEVARAQLLRDQEAARVKREDLKARKQAILPILSEIESMHQDFNGRAFNLESAWLTLKNANYPSAGPTVDQVSSATDEMRKLLSTFDVNMKADWAKIRILVEDETAFKKVFFYYREGVATPWVDRGVKCATDSFVGLAVDSLTDEDKDVCEDKYAANYHAMECLKLLLAGLENFDKPFDVVTEGKASSMCKAPKYSRGAPLSASH